MPSTYTVSRTSAAAQLQNLSEANVEAVELVALRNIDLGQALRNRCVINLLAVDIQQA